MLSALNFVGTISSRVEDVNFQLARVDALQNPLAQPL